MKLAKKILKMLPLERENLQQELQIKIEELQNTQKRTPHLSTARPGHSDRHKPRARMQRAVEFFRHKRDKSIEELRHTIDLLQMDNSQLEEIVRREKTPLSASPRSERYSNDKESPRESDELEGLYSFVREVEAKANYGGIVELGSPTHLRAVRRIKEIQKENDPGR